MKGSRSTWIVAGLGLVAWSKVAAAAPADAPVNAPEAQTTAVAAPQAVAAAPETQSAVAVSESAPAPANNADEPGQRLGAEDGLLGPVSIGGFFGAGFPRPFSAEGFVKIENVIGFGLEYSVLPKLSFAGTETTFNAMAGDLRIFPFQDGFFIGVGAGRQKLLATGNIALPAGYGSLTEQIHGETWFVNPRIGFLTTFAWGGTIGIDVGAQIPINATLDSTLPSGVAMSQDLNNVAHFLTKSTVPTINLLRIGMML